MCIRPRALCCSDHERIWGGGNGVAVMMGPAQASQTGQVGVASLAPEAPADARAQADAVGVVRRVTILGATGSVGQSTLDVIGRNPHLFEVTAVTANSNAGALAELARRHGARLAVLAD